MITKTILIISLILFVPIAEGKVTAPIVSATYVQALETANDFLVAWSKRDADSGNKLISANLSTKLKKENNEDWFIQYMSGLSNPRHISFEIGNGKEINSKRIVFPVILYEYYSGESKAFQYKSKIELVKEGDSWRVDVLPSTSDNNE
ncbi:MAG: hypothetical protein HZB62_14385 [Nitrospirae bacterium]|nr:hypothetical protein [Nitrospirota bacterium]